MANATGKRSRSGPVAEARQERAPLKKRDRIALQDAPPGKSADFPADELSNKAYGKALREPHVELVKLQERVKHAGLKVRILFEGRDGVGKVRRYKAVDYPFKCAPERYRDGRGRRPVHG